MLVIARGYLVYELTGSARLLGLVSAGVAVPLLLLSLFGGVIADRVPRKGIVQLYQASLAATALFVAVSVAAEVITWVHLLVAAMLQGAGWSLMAPARQALIPQLVGRKNIANAMALTGAGMSLVALVGPAVGGLLYATIGPAGLHYAVAATGLGAVLLSNTLPRLDVEAGRQGARVMADIRSGLSYTLSNRPVLAMLAVILTSALLVQPFAYMVPVFVTDIYHRGSGSYGLLVAMMGLGSLVGALAMASLGAWRRGLLLILGGFASGTALLLMAAAPWYQAAIAIMLLLGLGDATRRVLNQTLIIEQTEEEYRGRVVSVYTMIYGVMPLGVLPAGIAMDLFGPQITTAFLGAAMLVSSALFLATQKTLRGLP